MTELAAGFGALEGPLVDPSGSLYFTELAVGVHRLDHPLARSAKPDLVIPDRPNVGGLAWHREGGLVISGPDVSVVDVATGTHRRLVDPAAAVRVGRPDSSGFNDLAADAEGRLWVGILRRDPDGTRHPGEIWCVEGSSPPAVVHEDIHPNGIALSADGRKLFCADTFRHRVVVLELAAGPLLARETGAFRTDQVPGYPDGVVTDVEGSVWVAFWQGRHLARFAADGELQQTVELDAMPLSLCFAGPERRHLIVVTGPSEQFPGSPGAVLLLEVDVPGSTVPVVFG